jgi:hypothetical protein
MNNNFNIDFIFIITPHILFKHNNYLYQNIKNDNYFMETLIYDYAEPLNYKKNYLFTLQKILKIAIIRKYNNIMVLQSDILFKSNWFGILNSILNIELNLKNNDCGIIWLQSKQEYFTDYQLNEISNKQYYRFNLTQDKNNNVTFTHGNDGIIISNNIYIKLYYNIKQILKMDDIESINNVFSYVCANTNSFVIYPNLIISTKSVEPLYSIVYKIIVNKEKKYIMSSNHKYLNPILKNLMIQTCNTSLINNLNSCNGITELSQLKDLTTNDIVEEIEDDEMVKIYNDYIIPYKSISGIYNPNHFNIYYNFNKEIIEHFDWIFYKYYYDDLINNDTIANFEDSMCHYLTHGYKELRFICLDEYLYDKNDSELEEFVKQFDAVDFYEINKKEIDIRNLSKKPIIYYIKYVYQHINAI